jgi:hypothetical protein
MFLWFSYGFMVSSAELRGTSPTRAIGSLPAAWALGPLGPRRDPGITQWLGGVESMNLSHEVKQFVHPI